MSLSNVTITKMVVVVPSVIERRTNVIMFG